MSLLKRRPRAVYTVSDAADHLREPDRSHLDTGLAVPIPDLGGPSPDVGTETPGAAHVSGGSDEGGPARFAVPALLAITVVAVSVIVLRTIVGTQHGSRIRAFSGSDAHSPRADSNAIVMRQPPAGRQPSVRRQPHSKRRPHSRRQPPAGQPRMSTTNRAARRRPAYRRPPTVGKHPVAGCRPARSPVESEATAAQAPRSQGRRCPCGAVAEFGFER